jgi:hypothetical protein
MTTEEIDIDIDENLEDDDAAGDDDAEPTAADLDDVSAAAEPAVAADVESIQEILEKQEDTAEDDGAEDDEVVLATITKDEKLEPIDTRVVPIQETEFTCKRCFLVKHRSQLADKKRTLCRDCA